MDRQTVVKRLLSGGVMVTPETLEEVMKQDPETYLKKLAETPPAQKIGSTRKIECIVRTPDLPGEVTPEDAARTTMRKYELLRKMLLRKSDAVSINNVGRTTGKINVVGMVSEKMGDGFVLEDTTGTLRIKSKTLPDPDDVISVTGWMRDGTLLAETIAYPDIPITRDISSVEGRIVLSSDGAPGHPDADAVLTPNSLDGTGNERKMPNPAWVTIKNGTGKMTLLAYETRGTADRNVAVSWLRKRFIAGGQDYTLGTEGVITKIPDIMWIISGSPPWTENYKGVTIISTGRDGKALVDLNTRKVEMS